MANPTLNTVFRIKSHGGGGHYLTISGTAPLSNNDSLYLTTQISSYMQYWKVRACGNSFKIVSCANEAFALNYHWTSGYGNPGSCDIFAHSENSDSYVNFDLSGHAIVYRIGLADLELDVPLYMTPLSWDNNSSVNWAPNEGGDVVQYWLFEPVSLSPTTVYASVNAGSTTLTSVQRTANATYIYNALRNAGFTKKSACAVLGNFQLESQFDPGIWEFLNDTSRGYGIAQWTGATKFINYAHSNSIIPSATATAVNNLANTNPKLLMDTELEYLFWSFLNYAFCPPDGVNVEDHTGYNITYSEFITSSLPVETLALIFHDYYEKSNGSNASVQLRATYASQWYNYFS